MILYEDKLEGNNLQTESYEGISEKIIPLANYFVLSRTKKGVKSVLVKGKEIGRVVDNLECEGTWDIKIKRRLN